MHPHSVYSGMIFVGKEKHLKWVRYEHKRGWSHSGTFCRERDSTVTITCVSQCLVWEDSDATVTTTLSVTAVEAALQRQLAAELMWVFTHLFHLQIYVWGRSLNVALMVSPWWLSTVPASSPSSRLSPEMSDASRVTSHEMSYGREDSCGVLSLRLAIWTRTKSLCLPGRSTHPHNDTDQLYLLPQIAATVGPELPTHMMSWCERQSSE